jgi:hypothetical protein
MKDLVEDGLSIAIPETWESVGKNGPYGIAPTDGEGYMQFCVAFTAARKNDNGQKMLHMVLGMAKGWDLGEPKDIVTEDDPLPFGAASFIKDGEFGRLWEISENGSLISVVFYCRDGEQAKYLDDCEMIVRSVKTFECTPKVSNKYIKQDKTTNWSTLPTFLVRLAKGLARRITAGLSASQRKR